MPLHSSASGTDLHEALREKAPVRAATAVAVTLAAPGASIDGVTLVSSDRVLLKNQAAPAENGIYVWSGAATPLLRSLDALSASDFVYGFKVYVREGTVNGATHWVFSQSGAVTLGSTSLTFVGIGTGSGPTGAPGAQGVAGPPGALAVSVSGAAPYICIQDQKPLGTNGGTFTTGADRTRDLNTIVANDLNIATLVANQVTLGPGTYRCHILPPAYKVNLHQAWLFNVTTGGVLLRGRSSSSGAAEFNTTHSVIVGRFALGSTSVLEVRHRCSTTGTNTGFGPPASFGTEVYTIAEFWLEGGPPPFFGTTQALVPLPYLYIRQRRYFLLKHAASVFNLVGGDAQPGPESRMILP